jgi:hypothetical protein
MVVEATKKSSAKKISVAQDDVSIWLERTYNAHRNALLNLKYYSQKLAQRRRQSGAFELAFAIGTSGAVAAWLVTNFGLGTGIWAGFTLFTAAVRIAKQCLPFLPKDIERYTQLREAYTTLVYDLEEIVTDIRTQRKFTNETASAVRQAEQRYAKLALKDDLQFDRKLIVKYTDEVNDEVPVDKLWWPAS